MKWNEKEETVLIKSLPSMIGALLSLIFSVFFNFAPCLIWDKRAFRSAWTGLEDLVDGVDDDKAEPEEKEGGGGAGGGGGKGGIIKFTPNSNEFLSNQV